MKHLEYDARYQGEAGWIVKECIFDSRYLGKWEAVFTQGNGYLGVRNALEERYIGEQRGMFVNGTFNRFHPHEVPELPNFPDLTAMDIFVNGHRFYLEQGNFENYCRRMNYKTGESIRELIWTCPTGEKIQFSFHRFVSLCREHVLGNKIEITSLSDTVSLKLESGLDARITNTGVQHFGTPDSRIYDKKYIQTVSVTGESQITAVVQTVNRVFYEGVKWEVAGTPYIRNRRNLNSYEIRLEKGKRFCLEKLSTVHTDRDLSYEGMSSEEKRIQVREDAFAELKEVEALGFEVLLEESKSAWEEFWKIHDVRIETEHLFDQIAVRFAIYHLHIMNKPDDSRLGVGAKGLSGEEYKGHSFWDTEIFLMPYYLFNNPKASRTLLEYRFHILKGAREKAEKAGCKGAMYPWESAWIDHGEVCADIIGVDVETGKPMRVLCGEIEVHISADIAYALWEYYTASKDEEFMEQCGYEILLDTARFWASRAEWNEKAKRYDILNVIGPDEYKEEIDNDVYTNYMAYYNMKKAMEIFDLLPEHTYKRLDDRMDLSRLREEVLEVMDKLYLPAPGIDGIIPQNDTYLNLREIDLEQYKNNKMAGSIHKDYSMERLKEIKASKQGDLVVLMYLQDHLFSEEIKKKNYIYYEKYTTHDSSLSKCTHSILANDLGMEEAAYDFFEGAAKTDIGGNLSSSDNGIHSAACGGVWQCAVMGFGGVRIVDGELRVNPHLPKAWNRMEFFLTWRGKLLRVRIGKESYSIEEQIKYERE